MPYFYLARCRDGSLYAGSCKNLRAREAAHNAGKGAKYTRSRRPVTVVYSETLRTWSAALRREAAVKKLPKAKKEALVRGKGRKGKPLTPLHRAEKVRG